MGTAAKPCGDVDVSVPCDRKGQFEPQVLNKNQTSVSQDIEEKILSMYAKGMTTGDIEAHIQDIYGIDFRYHHQPHYRQDTALGERVAAATAGGCLRGGVLERHSLPRP